MPLFLCKRPSTNARVLEIDDCPPHNLVHDITSYPLFYDPLYHPGDHVAVFATSDTFCSWLQSALVSHIHSCLGCRSSPRPIAVTWEAPHINVSIDGTLLPFLPAYFESRRYSHCSIFSHYQTSQSTVSMQACLSSFLARDPLWFSSPFEDYRNYLSALPASVLRTVARNLGSDRMQTRRKDLCIDVIIQHVYAKRLEISGLSDEAIAFRLGVRLPPDTLKFRATFIAAEFIHLYGAVVAASIRRPSLDSVSIVNVANGASSHNFAPWTSQPLQELTRRLEKLPRADIQSCIRALPRDLHTLYNSHSHRKSCNALANYIRQRAMYLANVGAVPLCSIYLFHVPLPSTCDLSYDDICNAIIRCEFGNDVVDRFSQEIPTRSAADKNLRMAKKQSALAEARQIVAVREQHWPSVVPQMVILQRLNEYMDATVWTDPPICAVCSQYARDTEEFPLALDVTGLNLELLRLKNEHLIKKCVVQGLSTCFSFGHDVIDGLMLDHQGIIRDHARVVALRICSHCKSALSRSRLPALALANGLFRGELPSQFRDLTWVEEKSTDPAQPRVFHGNTCAHDMNIISTAMTLPRAPADVNGFISVVLIGPEKFDPKRMRSLFRVRKHKIWSFLTWLKHHNHLYADIPLDSSVADLYPVDDILPGLQDRVVEDHELDAQFVFETETAGFAPHPASLLHPPVTELTSNASTQDDQPMVEKMGVSDPESANISGRKFTACALRNLIPDAEQSPGPDLVLHHGDSPVTDYHNPRLFPGLYPTLYPYGVGGFEDHSRVTPLSIERQAKYSLNLSDRAFRYHDAYIFVVLNILQRRQAHLQTHFVVHRLEREFNTMSTRIPGSQSSKIFVRNEIRNYFGYFGLPHVFFTFNPSAAHSPIFQVMYGDKTVDLSARFPCMPSSLSNVSFDTF
ncbi:hypothetical protein BD769DRAFT_52350 [Suillus cothurnatus]|nr:hypothetical protein BD769DRAFT_52350 [Suillus cothurnatus]